MATKNPQRVAWSYAWAAMWMLRASEAAEVLVGHLTIDGTGRNVSLHIPRSKTDQAAEGAAQRERALDSAPWRWP